MKDYEPRDAHEAADFILKVHHAEREITFGPNADMYRQLVLNGEAFSDITWNFGVNYFFMGNGAFERYSSMVHVYGRTNFTYVDDQSRAIEIAKEQFFLPKDWGDLKTIADKRRLAAEGGLKYLGERLQMLDDTALKAIMSALADGITLPEKPPEIDFMDFSRALSMKGLEIHLHEMGVALDTIDELVKSGTLTALERNKPARLFFR